MEWTKIKDKPPENEVFVLVSDGEFITSAALMVFNGIEYWDVNGKLFGADDFTLWMPHPPLPPK